MAKANLSIIVTAVGALKAAQDIGKVDKSIVGLSKRTLGTTIRNVERLGIVAGGVLASQVMLGIRSLEELESATTAVDGAIKQLGLTGQLTGEQVATWANEIEAAVGAAFDDKAITAATATLLRYGKVTPGNLRPAMEVMTDLAAKTGGVEAASTLLAKALADPAKAAGKLARQGIVLTKAQQDTVKAMVEANDVAGAQTFLLDELAKTTKGAALASQGPFKRSMSILRDVIEDAQRALATGLLPVLQRVADWLSRELAKPAVMRQIREFGEGLARAFDQVLSLAQRIPWGTIADAMKLAGQGAKVVLDMFTSLPPWVQTAVITGWGLNKLTGGGLSAILGQLASGLVKGVLGVNAGVVNAKAGVVNVAGPVAGAGGAAGAAGRAGGGLMRGMVTIGTVALAAGSIYELAQIWSQTSADANQQAEDVGDKTQAWLRQQPRREDLVRGLAAVDRGLAELNGTDRSPIGLLRSLVGYASGTVDQLQKTRQSIVDQLATLDRGGQPARPGDISPATGFTIPKPTARERTRDALDRLPRYVQNLTAAIEREKAKPGGGDAARIAKWQGQLATYTSRLDRYVQRVDSKRERADEVASQRRTDTRSEAAAIRNAPPMSLLSAEDRRTIQAGLKVPPLPPLPVPTIPALKIEPPKVPPLAVPDLPLLRVEKQDALKVEPPRLPPLPVPTIPPVKVDMPPAPTLKVEPPKVPPLAVPTIPAVKVEPPRPLTVQPPVIPPLVAPLIPPLTLAKDTYERINAAVQPRQLADDTRAETAGIRRATEDGRRATDRVREEQRRLARFGEQTVAKTGEVKSAILSLPERIAAAMPRPVIPAPVVNVSSNTTVTISAKSVNSARTTFVRWTGAGRIAMD